jgi:hypothetical protein
MLIAGKHGERAALLRFTREQLITVCAMLSQQAVGIAQIAVVRAALVLPTPRRPAST